MPSAPRERTSSSPTFGRSPRVTFVPSLRGFVDFEAATRYVETDVTDEAAVSALFETTVDEFGSVDVLLNDAGVFRTGSVTDTSNEEWQTSLAVNHTGVFYCCKHGVPALVDAERASLVNVGSVFGLRGGVANFGSTATKGGVIALTKQLAVEFGGRGVRTNAVLPGFVETRMLADDTPPGTESYATEQTPQGRIGTPMEVASSIRFLVSDHASVVNGQIVAVDGGFLAG